MQFATQFEVLAQNARDRISAPDSCGERKFHFLKRKSARERVEMAGVRRKNNCKKQQESPPKRLSGRSRPSTAIKSAFISMGKYEMDRLEAQSGPAPSLTARHPTCALLAGVCTVYSLLQAQAGNAEPPLSIARTQNGEPAVLPALRWMHWFEVISLASSGSKPPSPSLRECCGHRSSGSPPRSTSRRSQRSP